eukprot:52464_1
MSLQSQTIPLFASELSHKEGEITTSDTDRINYETGSLPSISILANDDSLISEQPSASSSWFNLIQNKMKINDQPQTQPPLVLTNEVPPSSQTPSLISPPIANPAFQSLLSSANNIAFNPYPLLHQFNYHTAAPVQTQPNPMTINTTDTAGGVRSITVKFLTMYYNALHSNPGNLKRFYHATAAIDKLAELKNVLFVDIQKILHQTSIDNSILIRVNGTMKFPQHVMKPFEQIFVIYKSKQGFWLIQNDIFRLIDVQYKQAPKDENKQDVAPESNKKTEESMDLDRKKNMVNMVNKRMINKFYHDSSYQQYDNNLAIFIRPIPNHITHSKLCGILRSNLIKQCNNNGEYIDICIDYIDVNYHKQFAFVYFGNQETLNVALQMNELIVNGQQSQIQRKRSHNGPRKFFPKKRKQVI